MHRILKRSEDDHAISSVIATFLIVGLVILLAAVIIALIYGLAIFQERSVFVASNADVSTMCGSAYEAITLIPKAGEPFYLKPSRPDGTEVRLVLIDPLGVRQEVILDHAINESLYGKTLYLYAQRGNCKVNITDDPSQIACSQYRPFDKGKYTIQAIDENADLLIWSSDIGGGNTIDIGDAGYSTPTAVFDLCSGGYGVGNQTSICDPLTYTLYPSGNPPPITSGPCAGMCARNFSATPPYNQGQYMFYPDRTDFNFTGDLSISVWVRPVDIKPYNYGGNTVLSNNLGETTRQIFGKGQNDANDNYELFLIRQKIYFEWADKVTSQMYHVVTPDILSVGTNPWTYITVSVHNNALSIYRNGVSQPLTYYSGSTPGINAAYPQTQVVRLRDNNNPVSIGTQVYGGNSYVFRGSIGNVAVYNREMTAGEIQYNMANCRA